MNKIELNKNKRINMKTKLFILLAVVLGFVACENQETDFDDFGTTAVYFPFQTPARSLILGNYDLGFNENDNNGKFEIGVTMSGVYENKDNRQVHFKVAPELLNDVENVKALPESYYSIETASPVIIPAGDIKGRITVQLTDAFFQDTLAFAQKNEVNYVVPLLITEIENLDTLLVGLPAVANPSRTNEADWEIVPKDYTLYGIKFINKYHAYYLRRGVDVMTSSDTTITSAYHSQYIEDDELVMVSISREKNVELKNTVRRGNAGSPGDVHIELVFDDNDNCIVQSYEGDAYNVSGSGKFVPNGDTWGGKERDVIYLDYSYTDTANNESHQVKDTLVVRNRNVVFEEFTIQLKDE